MQNCEVQELLLVYVSGIPIFCSLLGPKSSISRDPTQNKYKDLIECTWCNQLLEMHAFLILDILYLYNIISHKKFYYQ